LAFWAIVIVVCLIFALGCSKQTPKRQDQSAVTIDTIHGHDSRYKEDILDISEYKLEDKAFWAQGDRVMDPVVQELKGSYFGVIVDAPKRIYMNEKDMFPVFTYYMGTFKELATRDYENQAIMTALDLSTNQLYWSWAIGDPPEGDEPLGEPDVPPELFDAMEEEEEIEGGNVSINELDLRNLLQLPWQPTRFMIGVIMLDMVSNRLCVSLEKSPSAYEDPEVAKFIAKEKATQNPPGIFPPYRSSAAFPQYHTVEDAPVIEDPVKGIALAVERVLMIEDNTRCILRGTYRLPISGRDTVKPANVTYNREAGLVETETQPAPTAIVTITLLITGSEIAAPTLFRLQVPSYENVTEDAGALVASGQFAIDLFNLPEMPRVAQTLFIYAFSEEVMEGPVLVGLVEPVIR